MHHAEPEGPSQPRRRRRRCRPSIVIRQKRAENSPRTTSFRGDQMKWLLRADSSTARTRRRSANPARGQRSGRRAHVKMCRRCGVVVLEEQQAETLGFLGHFLGLF